MLYVKFDCQINAMEQKVQYVALKCSGEEVQNTMKWKSEVIKNCESTPVDVQSHIPLLHISNMFKN